MGLVDDTKKEMNAALDHLSSDLKNIRTGRANPGLLDSVTIEVYGSEMRLADLANVTVPEPRQLLITPYDGNNANAIGKSIDKANLSVSVMVDGNSVRVTIPPMDEATRKEMVKLCSRKCEEGKISVRNVRRKFNDLARKQKTDGDITEDVLKRSEKEIQTLTDDFCKKVDEIAASKEKEVLTV